MNNIFFLIGSRKIALKATDIEERLWDNWIEFVSRCIFSKSDSEALGIDALTTKWIKDSLYYYCIKLNECKVVSDEGIPNLAEINTDFELTEERLPLARGVGYIFSGGLSYKKRLMEILQRVPVYVKPEVSSGLYSRRK